MALNPEALARIVTMRAASQAGQRLSEEDRQWTVDEAYGLLTAVLDLVAQTPNEAARSAGVAFSSELVNRLIGLASTGYVPTQLKKAKR